jgi:hypothetical protein
MSYGRTAARNAIGVRSSIRIVGRSAAADLALLAADESSYVADMHEPDQSGE